jgi:hypothetical protein
LLGLAQNLNKPTVRIGRLFGFGMVKMKTVGDRVILKARVSLRKTRARGEVSSKTRAKLYAGNHF